MYPTKTLSKTYWLAITAPDANPELKIEIVSASSVVFFESMLPVTSTDPLYSDVILTSRIDLFNILANSSIILLKISAVNCVISVLSFKLKLTISIEMHEDPIKVYF